MADVDGTGATPAPEGNSAVNTPPAWTAQLPDPLKTHEMLTPFKTLGDLGKSYVETAGKVKEYEGKLANAIFKPGENAKPEEIQAYRKAMGIPDKPDAYQFKGVDGKDADPKMVSFAQAAFLEAGLTPQQASLIGEKWNGLVQGISKEQALQAEASEKAATEAQKKEWGADYDKNVELTRRAFKRFADQEFVDYLKQTGKGNDPILIKAFHKIGLAMGEDTSPQGQGGPKGDKPKLYPNSPELYK